METNPKIAFFCSSYPDRLNGGVEAVTSSLAGEFTRRGINCYCIYHRGREVSPAETYPFVEVLFSQEPDRIRRFLTDHRISVLINQSTYDRKILSVLKKAVENTSVHVYSVFHSSPGFLTKGLKEQMQRTKVRGLERKIKKAYRLMFFDKYRSKLEEGFKKTIREGIDLSEKFILLSEKFIPSFIDIYHVPPDKRTKLGAIANPLSYDVFASAELIAEKQKEVLVVARFDELQKRLGIVLKIWSEVERDPSLSDWKLTMVGHGPDEKLYRDMTAELGLRRVTFEGKQNPLEYYKRASLFVMTSAYEGFGITLTEAGQTGCVPIVFDSFEAVHDLILSGENGILVADNDTESYTRELTALMQDDERRRAMAGKAVRMSKRFTIENIVSRWMKLPGFRAGS